jgi:hypothetical protein
MKNRTIVQIKRFLFIKVNKAIEFMISLKVEQSPETNKITRGPRAWCSADIF